MLLRRECISTRGERCYFEGVDIKHFLRKDKPVFLQEDADGEQETEEEDVAGGGSEHLVECLAVEGFELAESAEMEDEVNEHQRIADAGEGVKKEGDEGEDGGEDSQPKVDVGSILFSFYAPLFLAISLDARLHHADNNGALATHTVLVAVAVVVDHEEIVGRHSHSEACDDKGDVPSAIGHDVVGEDDGNESEEDEHQQVAPTEVGKACGVEEAEEDAEDTHDEEFPLRMDEQDADAHKTGEHGHDADAPLHSTWSNPPLCTSAFGAETVFAVGAFAEVEIVVDEVGINLHEDGEEKAEEEGRIGGLKN